MKKLFKILVALTMSISLIGCSSNSETTESETAKMKAGTYSATAYGMKSDITVEVTVDETSIVSVEVTECNDTTGIADAAIAEVPAAIVENQSVNVDAASGATMTSMAIKNAAKSALEEAGADMDVFNKAVEAVEKTEAETEEYDLVICGAGISGLSAAVEAARNSDLSVLVLEKESYTGGSARVCGGGIWAINADINDEIGQDSTLDEYIDFMKDYSGTDDLNTELMTNIYNKCNSVISYYLEHELPVNPSGWSLGNPDSQLPVLWSEGGNAESGLVDAVQTMAEELGVEIRVNSAVTSLVHEGNTVTGVTVEDKEHTYTVNADKVILATGGFTQNKELVEEYAPEYVDSIVFTGTGGTGDGITMTKDFNVNIVGEGMMGLMGVNAQRGYYFEEGANVWGPTMMVNKEGEDTQIGSLFYGRTLKAILDETDSMVYGIYDSTSYAYESMADYANTTTTVKAYDSLEELAEDQGIDYDTLAQSGADLAEGTLYCMIIRPLFIGSIPGLEVDANCRVLTADGSTVENLYACGELIFGNVFSGAYPSSGTGMATSTYTGAIAAEAAYTDAAK